MAGGVGIAVLLLATLLLPEGKRDEEADEEPPFDPFAGGYPVPPMPGQRLPELTPATVVSPPAGQPAARRPTPSTSGGPPWLASRSSSGTRSRVSA